MPASGKVDVSEAAVANLRVLALLEPLRGLDRLSGFVSTRKHLEEAIRTLQTMSVVFHDQTKARKRAESKDERAAPQPRSNETCVRNLRISGCQPRFSYSF